jgi:hypothetical protein
MDRVCDPAQPPQDRIDDTHIAIPTVPKPMVTKFSCHGRAIADTPVIGARLFAPTTSMTALRQKRSFNKHPFCELMSLGKIDFASPHFASDWLDAHRDLWRRWMQERNGEKRLIKSGDVIWTPGREAPASRDRPPARGISIAIHRAAEHVEKPKPQPFGIPAMC